MFANARAKDNSHAPDSIAVTPREAELATLRRRLYFGTAFFALDAFGTLAVFVVLMLRQFIVWSKALPQGVEPSWERLMQDQPSIFFISVAGGVTGAMLAVMGMVVLIKFLGRENWPTKKVIQSMSSLPIAFAVMGVGAILTSEVPLDIALALPLILGFTLSMVPLQLGLFAALLLGQALRQLRQRPTAIESAQLPVAATDYFNRVEADALEAGLTPLGDFTYLPHWKKYRRYWMAPNGAYFVDATWIDMDASTMSAVGVSSATSDGHYFETADQAPPAQLVPADPKESLTHVTHLPGAPLSELIATHIDDVGEWVKQAGCRPLEFAATDLHAFTNYGIAAYMRERRNDLLWLGNPYVGQPLPPLPGQPWQPEEEASHTPLGSW